MHLQEQSSCGHSVSDSISRLDSYDSINEYLLTISWRECASDNDQLLLVQQHEFVSSHNASSCTLRLFTSVLYSVQLFKRSLFSLCMKSGHNPEEMFYIVLCFILFCNACVCVCMCGFCNVCVCEGFVMCGCFGKCLLYSD